jgi:PAS domain S-box-containing protein
MATEPVSPVSLAPKFPLSVLFVENNPADAERYIDFLSSAEFDVTAEVAHSAEEFVEKLQVPNYDIVLADYQLGTSWTGMDALDLLHDQGLNIPFILLTAPLGDQIAVDYMKNGLDDYILKDRLDRLPVAIYRALEQRASRNQQLLAARALENAESKFRALAEFMPAAVFLQQGSNCTFVNRAAEAVTGYRRSQLMQMSFWQLVSEGARPGTYEQIHRAQSAGLPVQCQTRIVTKWGTERSIDCRVKVLPMEGGIAALITAIPLPTLSDSARSSKTGARAGQPGPVPIQTRKPADVRKDSAELSSPRSADTRASEEGEADARAVEQLEAILRAKASKANGAAKVRASKSSYVQ